jgi:hypothetical protein
MIFGVNSLGLVSAVNIFSAAWHAGAGRESRVGPGTHAQQTADIIRNLEPVIVERKPDLVLVYGDVNSTVAAALVCSKLMIPVGHVEAGLRCEERDGFSAGQAHGNYSARQRREGTRRIELPPSRRPSKEEALGFCVLQSYFYPQLQQVYAKKFGWAIATEWRRSRLCNKRIRLRASFDTRLWASEARSGA